MNWRHGENQNICAIISMQMFYIFIIEWKNKNAQIILEHNSIWNVFGSILTWRQLGGRIQHSCGEWTLKSLLNSISDISVSISDICFDASCFPMLRNSTLALPRKENTFEWWGKYHRNLIQFTWKFFTGFSILVTFLFISLISSLNVVAIVSSSLLKILHK